ncbi:NUDIX domain-containing protein [Anaerotignum sp.]
MTEVVAALIWDGDRFMACQRPAHKARGLLWEFVGGKVEPGETKAEALVRECREELGVTIAVGEVFMEVEHVYPDLTVHLTLFHARIVEGVPQKLEHNDIQWITTKEIDKFAFCPADEEILKKLKQQGGSAPLTPGRELVKHLPCGKTASPSP